MATKKSDAAAVAAVEGTETNSQVNMQQHGFSGDTVEVKLFKAENGEPVQVFVGLNSYNAVLHRDRWVRIPVEVANHLDSLTYSVLEADPSDPDNRSKDTWQERPRFPMQRK